jgi:hypothetical protein
MSTEAENPLTEKDAKAMTEAVSKVIKKSTRTPVAPLKLGVVRKHQLDTVYKGSVTETLDKLHAAGSTVLSITASPDVRGFEIISYTEK